MHMDGKQNKNKHKKKNYKNRTNIQSEIMYISNMIFTISLQPVQFVHPPTDVPVTDRYGAGAKYIFPDPSLPVAAFKDEMSS